MVRPHIGCRSNHDSREIAPHAYTLPRTFVVYGVTKPTAAMPRGKYAKGASKMPQKEEQIVVEFCNAWGDGATARPDVNKIISMFAEDGVWQLWVPAGPTFKGRDALRSEIDRQCGFSTFMHCGITKMVSSGRNVVT